MKNEPINKSKIALDLLNNIIPVVYKTPLEFANDEIDFSLCVSSRTEKLDLSLTPYLIPIIKELEIEKNIHKSLVFTTIQQGGKTLILSLAMLYNLKYNPGMQLIVYQSDDVAESVNQQKILPLMKKIPELKKQLDKPFSYRKDGYYFDSAISQFRGSGSDITSVSAPLIIADEIDQWVQHAGDAKNLSHLEMRKRSFNESLFLKICSVKGGKSSPIWQEFKKHSEGYWYLRCLKCKGLTMRSADIHNLNFNRDKENEIIENSIRLICPICKHKHIETDKIQMNIQGDYIHKNQAKLKAKQISYQVGALASQWNSLSWLIICEKQVLAGKQKSLSDIVEFDNSIRGLNHSTRRKTTEKEALFNQKIYTDLPKIDYCLMSCDTQDNGWWWIVRGYDSKQNSYLINYGFCVSLKEIDKIWNTKYQNKLPLLFIVDEGGHRSKTVTEFVANRSGCYTYKGGSYQFRYKLSENKDKLLLGKAKTYQGELLYTMYNLPITGEGDWLYPEDVGKEYLNQVTSHAPKKTKTRHSDSYENWEAVGDDHLFDCEKMMLLLNEFYQDSLRKSKPKKKKITAGFIT